MTGATALLVVMLTLTLLANPAQAAKKDPDGRYKGSLSYPKTIDSGPVTFRISSNGKKLKLTVSGQLRGRKVTKGRIDYDIGSCSRKANWTAKRVGRYPPTHTPR